MAKLKICPMLTPFDGFSVDEKKMSQFAEHLFSRGINYLFLCGTTGMGPALSFKERRDIILNMEPYAEHSIMQVGSLNLEDSLELATLAKDHGYFAIASLPPYYYYDVPEEWIIRQLSELSKVHPLIAYNFPVASNNRIEPHIIAESNRRGGNIIGIKETVNEVSHMMKFKEILGDEFKVFSGPDSLLIPSLRSGMDGAIGSSSNYIPALFAKLIDGFESDGSYGLQKLINRALAAVKSHGSWSANYSAVRILEKVDAGMPRPPVFPLDEKEEKKLAEELTFLKH